MILSRFKWAMLSSIAAPIFPHPVTPSLTGKLILRKTEHFQIVFAPSLSRSHGYGCSDKGHRSNRCVIGALSLQKHNKRCLPLKNIFGRDLRRFMVVVGVGIKRNKLVCGGLQGQFPVSGPRHPLIYLPV